MAWQAQSQNGRAGGREGGSARQHPPSRGLVPSRPAGRGAREKAQVRWGGSPTPCAPRAVRPSCGDLPTTTLRAPAPRPAAAGLARPGASPARRVARARLLCALAPRPVSGGNKKKKWFKKYVSKARVPATLRAHDAPAPHSRAARGSAGRDAQALRLGGGRAEQQEDQVEGGGRQAARRRARRPRAAPPRARAGAPRAEVHARQGGARDLQGGERAPSDSPINAREECRTGARARI